MYYNIYTTKSDEELQALVTDRAGGAEEALVERYTRIVRICARPYFLIGGDSEDLIQEGMLGLLYAIREYDRGKGASLKHLPRSVSITVLNPPSAARSG